ncbi:hypothetical protein ACQTPQ_09255 [Streptococcus hyovaginalis]|uniref:hypothetical protein n=1 Tax=Streptococcus hyovaginalis TaxID=149015 RepID=UPI003AD9C5D6
MFLSDLRNVSSALRGCDYENIDFYLTAKCKTGGATPDMENAIKLAEILDVSLDELILEKEAQTIVERVVEKLERDIKQLV